MDSGNGSTVDILKNIDTNEYNKTDNRVKDNWISKVALGGYYNPKKCRSRHKVAILVPYRNREKNLAVFTNHMHPFLIKQQLEYRIFIIEQAGKEVFNRGKLFNIAFVEMMKYNDWHCVVLHDVDLLPQGDRILYTCPTFPRHMCGTVLEKAKLFYHTLFGGVSALSVQHYKQINGFSNLYWGWGGEDNDMFWRLQISQIPIVRYNKTVALYKSLPHRGQPKNKYRYKLLAFTMAKYKTDGLSSLVYKVIWTKLRPLYTHILADVNPLREKITDVYSNMFGFVL
ncbi:beta-1,4-N-acetylgalactosaminyltransferase bre-4 [Manduca sexta]|uniref:beta-1,4-N-acetylgalactosaminyltransferase bre-4 n=1 Tax=Manduca sexta TaxID=7130 RepID=UPI00188FF3E0|nr:beta-1,4-N-acetylgalactosaminyltransferase bre-4 [Manduca sexta]